MSQHGGYDQALLDEAPVATRAQRQEGYNVDLLDTRPSRPVSTQPLPPPPQPIIHRDTDAESNPQEKFVPGASTYAQKPTQSFWRTRNGKITILVIVVLVLGAVIGGAVGGVVGKKSSNDNSNPPPLTSSLTSVISTTPFSSTPTAVTSTTGSSDGVGSDGGGSSQTTSSRSSFVTSSGAPAIPSTGSLAEDSQ